MNIKQLAHLFKNIHVIINRNKQWNILCNFYFNIKFSWMTNNLSKYQINALFWKTRNSVKDLIEKYGV